MVHNIEHIFFKYNSEVGVGKDSAKGVKGEKRGKNKGWGALKEVLKFSVFYFSWKFLCLFNPAFDLLKGWRSSYKFFLPVDL